MPDKVIRAVADTNVLISATIANGNEFALFRAARLGKIRLVLSSQIIKEFAGVISRPRFGLGMRSGLELLIFRWLCRSLLTSMVG